MEKTRYSEQDIVKFYRNIREDYAFNDDIFNDDDERVRNIKEVVQERLTASDRTLIILYAETQSYRKLAKVMGVSHATIRTQVKRIQDIIKKEICRKGEKNS